VLFVLMLFAARYKFCLWFVYILRCLESWLLYIANETVVSQQVNAKFKSRLHNSTNHSLRSIAAALL